LPFRRRQISKWVEYDAGDGIMETMVQTIERVDDALMKEIVHRIVACVNPERIVLFGSYAYGKPTPESDLDILVIVSSDQPRYQRAVPIYRALAGLLIPKDVLVYTPEEVAMWSEVAEAFITSVWRQGKVIYEKAKN
jgi:predicted nucleotidyltransferase